MKHGAKVCGSCGRSQPPPPSSEKPKVDQSGDKHISSLTPTRITYPPNSELVVPTINKTPGAQGTQKNQHPSAHALPQLPNNNEQFMMNHTRDQHSGGVSYNLNCKLIGG
jgi:hypothetical protein